MRPMDLMEALGELPEEDVAEELAYAALPKRTAFLVSKPFLTGVSAAACLFVTVGLGFGIWAGQQEIESRPPQETAAVLQTQTTTQTTALSTTQTTSTAAHFRTQTSSGTASAALASSTGLTTQTTAISVQTRTVATAIVSMEPNPEPVITPEPPMDTTAVQLPETTPAAPETTTQSQTVQTERTTLPTTTTDPPSMDTDPPGGATAPVHGDAPYPGEPAFHTQVSGMQWTITPVCMGDEPETFELPYQITGERYRIESVETNYSASSPFRLYQLYDAELGRYWLLSQFPMNGFSQEIYWDSGTVQVENLQDVLPVAQISGFVITYTFPEQSPEYTVCWTDGNYIMVMNGSDSRLLTLDLPEHFRAE